MTKRPEFVTDMQLAYLDSLRELGVFDYIQFPIDEFEEELTFEETKQLLDYWVEINK